MKFRFILITFTFVSVFSYLGFRFFELQIRESGFYSARAESQYRSAGFLEPKRGTIFLTDKNKNSIRAALNKIYPIVYAEPKKIEEQSKTIDILSEILELDADYLMAKLSRKKSLYEPLAVKISNESEKDIKEVSLPGIYIERKEFRFYPYNNLAASVLGFIAPSSEDSEIKGRYGVEAFFEDKLKGEPGNSNNDKITEPKDGADVFLSLDRDIQGQAEKILSALIEKENASGGSVIVQDPKTGKILAIANNPGFDPNNYSKANIADFLNPAIQSIYEPGSVFKVITMAAGIDSGKITAQTQFYDTGELTLNGKTIKNWDGKAYRNVTMAEVIEHSMNTGAAFAARKTGREDFYNYAVKFGFNEKTGISLPGEVNGNLKTITKGTEDINLATASFGQGIAVTPIALINAISAIANGGALMEPDILENESPKLLRRVVSLETAKEVTKIMVNAVKKAELAQIPNYTIAGKTGTAQVPDFKRGGYTEELIHSYVGFAPASDPKFTILIKLDKPQVGRLAGSTVVPAFRELTQFLLNYFNIAPDDISENRAI